jgi:type II secretory pathway component PulM
LAPGAWSWAFDSDSDDSDLLRTVVMLLRTAAITATVHTAAAEVATAEDKIADALGQFEKIDSIKTTSKAIQKSVSKIDSEGTGIRTAIQRLPAGTLLEQLPCHHHALDLVGALIDLGG